MNQTYLLNEEQKKATLADGKIILVRSAVGSGKTRVLVHKILYLLEQNTPDDIMVLSFTRKAADEIRNRLIEADVALKKIEYCGTFHSIANQLLRNYFDVSLLGLTPEFSIIDEYEQQLIIENICFDYRIRLSKNMLKKMFLPETENHKNYILLRKEYQAYKKRCNLVDFYDLIAYMSDLLDMEKLYFSHIVIDEFQDIDELQASILQKFIHYGSRLFAVGDPFQTIYGWRGSNPKIFDIFAALPGAKELELSLNYRSTASIIGGVKGLFTSSLYTQKEPGEKIYVREFLNSFYELLYTVNKIKEIVATGGLYSNIAILYRRQNERKTVAKVLQENDVPFVIQRQPQIEEIPVLNWLLELLSVCFNSKNAIGLRRVLSNSKYGVKGDERKTIKEKIASFASFISTRKSQQEVHDYLLLDELMRPTSLSFSKDKLYVEAFWQEIIPDEHVVDFASALRKSILCREFNLSKIIECVEEVNTNGVQIMTLHNSKGLEFSHVFIIGANEGNIPLAKSDTEEEKRLFYVGITRAKDYVGISYCKEPEIFGVEGKPSRFIHELSKNCVTWETMKEEKTDVGELTNAIKEKQTPSSTVKKAYHPKYGEGHVVTEDEQNITVYFPNYEEKTFSKLFCPLTFE